MMHAEESGTRKLAPVFWSMSYAHERKTADEQN